jgi:hypothetical protein
MTRSIDYRGKEAARASRKDSHGRFKIRPSPRPVPTRRTDRYDDEETATKREIAKQPSEQKRSLAPLAPLAELCPGYVCIGRAIMIRSAPRACAHILASNLPSTIPRRDKQAARVFRDVTSRT